MGKYDEIICSLSAAADRKRDLKKAKAKAEIDAIDREYFAYIDGIYDAVKQIRAAEETAGEGGEG